MATRNIHLLLDRPLPSNPIGICVKCGRRLNITDYYTRSAAFYEHAIDDFPNAIDIRCDGTHGTVTATARSN